MKSWQAVVGGLGAMALLAACGGGGFADESPEAILDAAEKDMEALSSVSMNGQVTNDGQELELQLSLNTRGDCEGSISMEGGTAEIRSVGGQSWMKADEAFWTSFAGSSAPQITALVGDKWVTLPGDDGDFSSFCDLDEFLSDIDDDGDSKAEAEGTEDVGGEEAVKLSAETDDGDPVTAWVAVDEPHYILKMEVTDGDEPGTMTFSDFDEELDVEAPAEDEVVDLSQLAG